MTKKQQINICNPSFLINYERTQFCKGLIVKEKCTTNNDDTFKYIVVHFWYVAFFLIKSQILVLSAGLKLFVSDRWNISYLAQGIYQSNIKRIRKQAGLLISFLKLICRRVNWGFFTILWGYFRHMLLWSLNAYLSWHKLQLKLEHHQ